MSLGNTLQVAARTTAEVLDNSGTPLRKSFVLDADTPPSLPGKNLPRDIAIQRVNSSSGMVLYGIVDKGVSGHMEWQVAFPVIDPKNSTDGSMYQTIYQLYTGVKAGYWSSASSTNPLTDGSKYCLDLSFTSTDQAGTATTWTAAVTVLAEPQIAPNGNGVQVCTATLCILEDLTIT